jgi:hypothetical protein
METKGKLIEKFETQIVSEKFKKREFVLEIAENPQYPETVKFELQQDKCSLIDLHEIGSELAISFNLRGRAWTNNQGVKQYFNTLQAWKISGDENNEAF